MNSFEEVVAGMGEMLSWIHWVAGYDGRDIEFVIAGAGFGVRFCVIDFNQMRRLDSDQSCILGLVQAFFSNDPYYPRPVTSQSLYQTFPSGKSGFSNEMSSAHMNQTSIQLCISMTVSHESNSYNPKTNVVYLGHKLVYLSTNDI